MKFLIGILSLIVIWFVANAIRYRGVEKMGTCPLCHKRQACSTHHTFFPRKRWHSYKQLRAMTTGLCQQCHDDIHAYWWKHCEKDGFVYCKNDCPYRKYCCYSSFYTLV